MQIAYLKSLAETEVIHVDHEAFGNFRVKSLHAEFLHGERKLTTGLHTFGVTYKLNGNVDNHRLLVEYFEKVHVED